MCNIANLCTEFLLIYVFKTNTANRYVMYTQFNITYLFLITFYNVLYQLNILTKIVIKKIIIILDHAIWERKTYNINHKK